MVWRDYSAFFWLSRGWWPTHTISTHLEPFLFMGGGTRLDIIVHMLWVAMLVLPEDTTLNFTTKTTSPLCKLLGNKLQECVSASFMQALIHLLPILLYVFWKVLVQKLVYLISSKKNNETKILSKQTDSFKIKFDKNVILKYICTSIFSLLFWRWSTSLF